MSEIEKIKRYIQRTRLNEDDGYYLNLAEAMELTSEAIYSNRTDVANIINLAFNYGKAKGYRAAKAERKAVAK